ncbi:vpr protein [Simian immunodeficiency virus]|uniref:Vpr protein n=1 Tax=Simian immunodeficiency virus TaxID=11723 RepID=Q699U9_SIV|nr:vpr protein [Simian immunodeficiency virus]
MAQAFFRVYQRQPGEPLFYIPRNVNWDEAGVISATAKAEQVAQEACKHFTAEEIFGVWNQCLEVEAGPEETPTMAWIRCMLDMHRALNFMLFEHFAAGCPQRTKYARHRGYPHPS